MSLENRIGIQHDSPDPAVSAAKAQSIVNNLVSAIRNGGAEEAIYDTETTQYPEFLVFKAILDKDAFEEMASEFAGLLHQSGVGRRCAWRAANGYKERFFAGTPDQQLSVATALEAAVEGLGRTVRSRTKSTPTEVFRELR